MKKDPTKFEQLRSIPLFAACSPGELRIISSNTTMHRFEAGTVLMEEGSRGGEFFVVIEGVARVVPRGRAEARIGPGGYVGELSLLDPRRRRATVVADTDLVVFVSDRREFAACLDAAPTVAYRLLASVVGRLRDVNDELEAVGARRS